MQCCLCGASIPDLRHAYLWPDAVCQACWLELPGGMVADEDGDWMCFAVNYLAITAASAERVHPQGVGTLEGIDA